MITVDRVTFPSFSPLERFEAMSSSLVMSAAADGMPRNQEVEGSSPAGCHFLIFSEKKLEKWTPTKLHCLGRNNPDRLRKGKNILVLILRYLNIIIASSVDVFPALRRRVSLRDETRRRLVQRWFDVVVVVVGVDVASVDRVRRREDQRDDALPGLQRF